jgi:hypothetical protein
MEIEKPQIPVDLYPIVICQSRYGGVYEGGEWFCIPRCESIPEDAVDEDCVCVDFWHSDASSHIGVGDSPNEALLAMLQKHGVKIQENQFQEAFQRFKNRTPISGGSNYTTELDIERTGYFKRASGFHSEENF